MGPGRGFFDICMGPRRGFSDICMGPRRGQAQPTAPFDAPPLPHVRSHAFRGLSLPCFLWALPMLGCLPACLRKQTEGQIEQKMAAEVLVSRFFQGPESTLWKGYERWLNMKSGNGKLN